jgi:hypothetical protein
MSPFSAVPGMQGERSFVLFPQGAHTGGDTGNRYAQEGVYTLKKAQLTITQGISNMDRINMIGACFCSRSGLKLSKPSEI